KGTTESLRRIDEDTFLSIFEGVPIFEISPSALGISATQLLAGETGIFASRGEVRRLIAGGGVSINKEKLTDPERQITANDLLNDRYLLVQKGKKNYFLIRLKEN
ncbi:MAG: S4 domain-containing protein, partial [Bacteroidales bacterium]